MMPRYLPREEDRRGPLQPPIRLNHSFEGFDFRHNLRYNWAPLPTGRVELIS